MKRQYLILIIAAISYGQNSVKLPSYLQLESVKKYNVEMAIQLIHAAFFHYVPSDDPPFIPRKGLKKKIVTINYFEQEFDKYVLVRSSADTIE